jgi:hypothetical protein
LIAHFGQPTLEGLGIVYFFSVKDKNYTNTTGRTLQSWVARLGGNKESIERVLEERYYILFQLLARRTIGLLKGINN